MGLADQMAMRESALVRELSGEGMSAATELAERLLNAAAEELRAQGLAGEKLDRTARVQVRYQGSDTTLSCLLPMDSSPAQAATRVREDFEQAYRRRFEFTVSDQRLMIESVSVECVARGAAAPAAVSTDAGAGFAPAASAEVSMYCFEDAHAAGWRNAKMYRATELTQGARIVGPAILAD